MFLYKTSGPLRQTSQVTGLYPNDTWSGRTVIYRRVNCSGGSLAITLRSDASLKTGPQTVTASELGHEVARVTLRPGATRKLDIPLSEKGDVCAVVFTITPTAIPAVVTHGVNPDGRVLGVHFNRFDYHP